MNIHSDDGWTQSACGEQESCHTDVTRWGHGRSSIQCCSYLVSYFSNCGNKEGNCLVLILDKNYTSFHGKKEKGTNTFVSDS